MHAALTIGVLHYKVHHKFFAAAVEGVSRWGLARAPAMALAALRRALQRGGSIEASLAACGSRALADARPAAKAWRGARWLSGGVPMHEVRRRLCEGVGPALG